ncbi:autotransporter outer membrane beta-barrel domain-containing protein [Bradyrhizobium sp. dw_78]|uniref:autotransporter family protein n=1 Tax=Bradyrhizobium sp. dw_78 TaxID=2719793 RepID=UPI001BD6CC1F|nr:autotransporter outer membrane beta-barrel domain-containing protein [Bradyrhizobium sp. dw_78]
MVRVQSSEWRQDSHFRRRIMAVLRRASLSMARSRRAKSGCLLGNAGASGCGMAIMAAVLSAGAQAQTVPDGTNLATLGAPTNTTVWNLQGGASLYDPAALATSFGLTLPGMPGLTINGATGGSTITLNDAAGHFGYFSAPDATTLTLNNITLTGGSETDGGAINGAGALTVSGSGLTLLNNAATGGRGGGIYAVGAVTVNAPLTATDNIANTSGGAIYAGGDLTANGNVTATGNTATVNSGGALYSAGNMTLTGATNTLTNNTAVNGVNGVGGALFALGNVTVVNALTASGNRADVGGAVGTNGGSISLAGTSGNLSLTGNTATLYGGSVASLLGNITLGNAAGTVTITGNNAGGSGGAIGTLAGGSVTLTGSGSVSGNTAGGNGGAIATGILGGAGDITLTASGGNLSVTSNTAGGNGGALFLASGILDLNATGGNITFSNNSQNTSEANAVYINNAGGGSQVNLNAASGNNITYYDPIQNNAANGLISVVKQGAGLVNFDGSLHAAASDRWSQAYATTTVQAGTFAVSNNAVYGVLAADVGAASPSSFTVAGGATLSGGSIGEVRADNFALNGTLDIAGMQAGTVGNKFTVTSNNVSFGSASQVLFNTYLNDGSVQRTDQLTLNLNGSATSGTASVHVTNVGGPGAVTTGNGIELVNVTNNNGSTAGAFTLGNRVAAGPYEYTLFYGSVDASGPQNWYLRSTLDCSPSATSLPCPSTTPSSPAVVPNYRPETSLYASLPSMVLLYGRSLLDTLHERVGEESPGIASPDGNGAAPSLGWGRILALGGKQGGDTDGIYGSGPRYDYSIFAFQGGTDLYRAERSDGGSDHVGVYTAIGGMSADVAHVTGLPAGSNSLTAYTLGGYWTRFSATGWYVDAVAQYTWNDLKADPIGISGLSTHGGSFATSLETGKSLQLGQGFSIEPQAQLVYQTASLAGTADSFASVIFNDVDSLAGRIGARVERSWAIDPSTPQSRLMTVWLRPSLWYEFLGDPHTSFSSATGYIPFRSDLGGGWVEVTAGLDAQISRNVDFYANGLYQISFNGRSDAFGGKFGARVTW